MHLEYRFDWCNVRDNRKHYEVTYRRWHDDVKPIKNASQACNIAKITSRKDHTHNIDL